MASSDSVGGVETVRSQRGEIPRSETVPGLTVLHHPDARRVGDAARLTELRFGGEVALSRLAPDFVAPGESAGRPLGDLRLSRRPIVLRPEPGGGVTLTVPEGTEAAVDGERVQGVLAVSGTAIDGGVVVEVAGRVVLLLGRLGPPGARSPSLGLVGEGAAVERVRAEVLRVADLAVPVLLRGETGTGKELVARAIHERSGRSNRPCINVNMGALSPGTAASELFGHVRGAFTGSVRDHDGFFTRAHGGTLFLDEIGDTPPDVQVALLRVLETGEIQPVGGPGTRRVDVRLVAATDSDLERAAAEGRFRAPLLHRLAGYEILLPPLRERREDIGRLLVHFLRIELAALGELHRLDADVGAGEPWLPAALAARLARHAWPGNVRQLRNVARQLAIGSRGAPSAVLTPAVARVLDDGPRRPAPDAPAGRKPSAVSHEELLAALRENGWRIRPTAERLGLPRTSLYRLIEKSPLLRRAKDLSEGELGQVHSECQGDVEAMAANLEVSPRGLLLRLRELGLAS